MTREVYDCSRQLAIHNWTADEQWQLCGLTDDRGVEMQKTLSSTFFLERRFSGPPRSSRKRQ